MRSAILINCLVSVFLSTNYFGGAQSKGFATLKNVSKLQFFDKIGHAKSVGFLVLFGYLTKRKPN